MTTREPTPESTLDNFRSDELRWNVRYALRRLAKRPGYAAAIVLVTALGIGATTAMFSAVDAVMLRALPFHEPSRLVTLSDVQLPFASAPGKPAQARAALDVTDVAAMPELFSAVAAYAPGRLNFREAERPLRLRVGVVTEGFFRTLGIRPAVGRPFASEETVPGGGAVAILSDALWRRQFGARAMLGETILLDDRPYEVIGVMPPGFSFPEESDLWIPMSIPTTPATFTPFGAMLPWEVVARLAPGVEIPAADRRLLDRWTRTLDASGDMAETREDAEAWLADLRARGTVRPLQASLAGARARTLLVLLGATALLLLIACANITNLLLTDAATRTREMALRTALGASQGRIFRQVLIESVILAVGGTVAGLLMAPAALWFISALLPTELAGVAVPRLDWRVLGFASSLGLATGIGFGLWPARRASRIDPGEALKSSGNPLATGRHGARGARILIVVEIALTVMLLVGSGLLLRSLAHLMGVDRGMETGHVGALELSFASPTPDRVRLTRIEAMLDRLRRTPGIESAAAISDLPLGSDAMYQPLDLANGGGPAAAPDAARYVHVSQGYFATLGISLVSGRDFTPRDDSLAPPTVIIDETLARRWFANADPVGRQLTSPMPDARARERYTVIGVVADAREEGLTTDVSPQLYHSAYRAPPRAFALLARGTVEPEALLAGLRNAVRAVDPSQAVGRARMMEQVVRDSVASQRANALLITLFGGLAVVLAALGVYSVVVHAMARRGRELGIRAALGATGADLLAMVWREMLVVVAIGITIGLAAAWAAARATEAMVYGITVHDPTSFAVGPVGLGFIAMAAAVVPLRSVFAVDPAEAMRSE